MRIKSLSMTLWTYETDAEYIEIAGDLDDLIQDKCESWRAGELILIKLGGDKRRYKKCLTNELLRMDYSDD